MKRYDAARAYMLWRKSLGVEGPVDMAAFAPPPRESIWCPYCDERYEDEGDECVTLHGEPETRSGYHEVTCAHCGADFAVEEGVYRWYESHQLTHGVVEDSCKP